VLRIAIRPEPILIGTAPLELGEVLLLLEAIAEELLLVVGDGRTIGVVEVLLL